MTALKSFEWAEKQFSKNEKKPRQTFIMTDSKEQDQKLKPVTVTYGQHSKQKNRIKESGYQYHLIQSILHLNVREKKLQQ